MIVQPYERAVEFAATKQFIVEASNAVNWWKGYTGSDSKIGAGIVGQMMNLNDYNNVYRK